MQGSGVEPLRLSASSTPFLRWLPAVIGVIISGILLVQGQLFGLAVAFLFAVITVMNFRFCEVTLDGRKLRISNYRGDVTVPLAAITRIEERRWTKPNGAIILHFDRDFGVGYKAEFMPHYIYKRWNPFAESDLVTELKQLVKDAQWEKAMKAANLPFELPRPE
jgi:hypothetical protein